MLIPTATFLLLILLVSFLFVLRHYLRFDYKLKTTKSITLPPGPAPWPLIGNLPELYFNKPPFRWVTAVMRQMKTDIVCIKLGSVNVITVSCPEIAREFLMKHDAIFASRPLTTGTAFISRGYLSVAVAPLGEQWKKMRRFLASQMLSSERLRWLHHKRLKESYNLLRYVYNQCKRSPLEIALVNVREVARQYSGNVIRKMLFNKRYLGEGREDGGPGKEEIEYVDAIFTARSHVFAFAVSDYVPCLRWLDLAGHMKALNKAINTIDKYHDPVIDQRVKEWRSSTNGIISKSEPEDLLDVFISTLDSSGNPLLSVEEIKAQVCDLLFAAVDNTSNAVEWAMAEMLNQPEVLRKAVEELDRVVGKDRLVQEADFGQLNYVMACLREAFRLHPVTSFSVPHVSTRDAAVAGYFIPKGSHVLVSRTGLGRNPKVWDDPLKFKPERHVLGSSTPTSCSTELEVDLAEPDLRFVTFSTGRRGCMAPQLGTATTIMLLARLLQAFTWTPPAGISTIDLSESPDDLFLINPLLAHAEPRLPPHLYPQLAI